MTERSPTLCLLKILFRGLKLKICVCSSESVTKAAKRFNMFFDVMVSFLGIFYRERAEES